MSATAEDLEKLDQYAKELKENPELLAQELEKMNKAQVLTDEEKTAQAEATVKAFLEQKQAAQLKQENIVRAEAEKIGVAPETFVRMGRKWKELSGKGWSDSRKRKYIKGIFGVEINPDL